MWSDYSFNSENFENISSQCGFLSLPHIFHCAVAFNKYFHRFSNVSLSVRMFSDKTNTSNYRPISQSSLPSLPTLSNILERAVHLQLYQYLITNNLLSNKQFGFRKGSSTTTALTSFADEVLLNMEQGKLCGAVFIDLTKAFDTVDHQIMLCKLSEIGLSETALHWFRSYLTGRQ